MRQFSFSLAIVLSASSCLAAEWPDHPVRVIVPFEAGGSADLISRRLMDQISHSLGQQFFVDNRPGGGGIAAARTTARAAPDGYTFIESGMSSFVLAPAMNTDAAFDPVADFRHVAFIGGAPSAILVNPSLGVTTFKDLLAKMRQSSGGMEYATPGAGTVGNIVVGAIGNIEKLKFTQVPYKGGSGALIDVLSGRLKMAAMNWSTVREYVASGQLIALAVSSRQRLPSAAQVPTLAELGYSDIATTTWQAISAPKGLPDAIADRFNKAVLEALKEPGLVQQLNQEGVETEAMTSSQVDAFVRSEVAKWTPIVKASIAVK
jgi:tripartite-type tricarboxylate transporter receptor subunit TctC